MAEQLLTVDEVTRIYEGRGNEIHLALNRVSFAIKRGEIFGLLGPNGAGKTTLIKILLGLTKPTHGRILVDGMEVSQNREAKKLIGYVPEKVAFYENLSALETMYFYSDLKEVPRDQCVEVLERVGLRDYAKQRVGTFSKGMLQRIGVAQALLSKPKLLVLDEPTSGLDPLGVIQFKQLIQDLNREGITILFTSHIMSEVEELAHRIAIIQGGKLLAMDSFSGLQRQMGLKPQMKITLKVPSPKLIAPVLAAGAEQAVLDMEILKVTCAPELKAEVLAAIQTADGVILDLQTLETSLEEIFVRLLGSGKELGTSA